MVVGCSPVAVTSDFRPASRKELLDIQGTIECRFTLKCVGGMIRIYSRMHRTGKYSKHSSTILSVWLYGCVFVFEQGGCRFESSCNHILGTTLDRKCKTYMCLE